MAKDLACTTTLQTALLHIEQGNAALAGSTLKVLTECPRDKTRNCNCAYADECAVQDIIAGLHQIWNAPSLPERL